MSINVAVSHASDEDVALAAPGDIEVLFPADQVIVEGSDGAFDANDRRTLTSSTVDFSEAGLRTGHVVRLTRPSDRFPTPGAAFGVAGSQDGAVTLRRLGMASVSGAPAAPDESLAGVAFVAATLGPQLERASRELDRLLGFGPESPVDRSEDPGTLDALRDAVVRLVLARRYDQLAREGKGAFHARANAMRAEFLELRAWLNSPGGPFGSSPRFGTRLSR